MYKLKPTYPALARIAAVIAVTTASLLIAACQSKEAEDLAAIRAMMEKQEAELKAGKAKEQEAIQKMIEADRAARSKQ